MPRHSSGTCQSVVTQKKPDVQRNPLPIPPCGYSCAFLETLLGQWESRLRKKMKILIKSCFIEGIWGVFVSMKVRSSFPQQLCKPGESWSCRTGVRVPRLARCRHSCRHRRWWMWGRAGSCFKSTPSCVGLQRACNHTWGNACSAC